MTTTKKFAKVCGITGKGMNEGYYIENGILYNNVQIYYVSTEKILKKIISESEDCKTWEEEIKTVNTKEEWFYWTEWDIDDLEEYYDQDGQLHKTCTNCGEETAIYEEFYFCNNCLTHL